MNVIYLAGGCFWGCQAYFDLYKGIIKTEVGFIDGESTNITYEEVCDGKDTHTETVKIEYSDEITLSRILDLYFEIIDPTSLNKQGHDEGIQYRTGIYYTSEHQLEISKKYLDEAQKNYDKKIVVELKPARNYVAASEYHQDYLKKNPSGYCHIDINKYKGDK